jgi:hypothetical protein
VLALGWKPEWAAWSNLLFFFLIGAWLPVSHLVDKLDTDVELFRDLGIVLFLHILCCNPLFAFVFYGLGILIVWAITRADINWSLLGVMTIYVLLRILFELVLMLVDYADPADWLTVGIAFSEACRCLRCFWAGSSAGCSVRTTPKRVSLSCYGAMGWAVGVVADAGCGLGAGFAVRAGGRPGD